MSFGTVNEVLLEALAHTFPDALNSAAEDEVYDRGQNKQKIAIFHNTLNNMLELVREVDCTMYKLCIKSLRENSWLLANDRVKLKYTAGLNVIRAVGHFCGHVCDSNCKSDDELDKALKYIRDMFEFFIIPKKCWIHTDGSYLLSMMVIAAHKIDPFVKQCIEDLLKDSKCEQAINKLCERIAKTEGTTVSQKFAKDYIYARSIRIREREQTADSIADALLEQEEMQRQKDIRRKQKKKAKAQKKKQIHKTPWVDDGDKVFEEDECIVCMNCDPEVTFDCGHRICCAACSEKVGRRCPVCAM